MAEYPRLNRSPFFRTFANAHRIGNVVQNKQRLAQRSLPGAASAPVHEQAGGHTPPSAPPIPQNAAERFQQANRGLPDGVRFEPSDEETRAALYPKATSLYFSYIA